MTSPGATGHGQRAGNPGTSSACAQPGRSAGACHSLDRDRTSARAPVRARRWSSADHLCRGCPRCGVTHGPRAQVLRRHHDLSGSAEGRHMITALRHDRTWTPRLDHDSRRPYADRSVRRGSVHAVVEPPPRVPNPGAPPIPVPDPTEPMPEPIPVPDPTRAAGTKATSISARADGRKSSFTGGLIGSVLSTV